jgi:radical SAM protein with 4Fe4S-binding SPASM domain
MQNILQAVQRIDVDVGCNFDDENIDSFAGLLKYLQQLGLASKLHAVRFKPIMDILEDRQGLLSSSELDCVYSKPETARHMIELRNLALQHGFKLDPGIGVNMCGIIANHSIFTIDPRGKIYRCPALVGRSEFEAGEILGEEITEKNPPELWKRCTGCPYLPLCGDGCLYSALLRFGDPFRLNCPKEYIEYVVQENLKLNYLNRQTTRG